MGSLCHLDLIDKLNSESTFLSAEVKDKPVEKLGCLLARANKRDKKDISNTFMPYCIRSV